MARRSFGGRGSLPAPKRQIANDGVDAVNYQIITMGVAASGAVGLGSLTLTEPALTLVRTRGSFSMKVRTSGASLNGGNGAYGIIVASTQALAAGLASLPLPMTDIENDWVVWVPFTWFKDATGTNPADLGAHRHLAFDSRGMRKLKLGEALVGVVEVFQEDNTTGTIFEFASQFRMQLKL